MAELVPSGSDVSAGTYRCTQCGEEITTQSVSSLPPCPSCVERTEGRFRTEHHGLLLAQMLAHIDFVDESVADLSARIEEVIAPFSDKVALLCTIPGIRQRTAEAIIAEIGIDMTRFPTSAHLASWAAMCPGNNESAANARPAGPAMATPGCAKR